MKKPPAPDRTHAEPIAWDKHQAIDMDPVAAMVRERYERAKRWRAQERVGARSVNQILLDCHDQYHGVLTPSDQELVEQSGVDVVVSLTQHKCDVLTAWTRDLLLQSADSPFVVEATPQPDLSDAARARVLQQLKAELLGGPPFVTGPEALIARVRQLKTRARAAQDEEARAAAEGMQNLIRDQLVEGGFRDQLMDYLFNFSLYPYAVLLGPLPEMRPAFRWSGRKPVNALKPVLAVRNISPFDYFWSPDSPGAGKGTYDIVVETMTKQKLLQIAQMPGFITDNVLKAVEHYTRGHEDKNWLSPHPERPAGGMLMWGMDESIDVLRMYGMLSSKELHKYGISVPEGTYHECEALVIGYWTIRLLVNPNPNVQERPVCASAYQKLPGKLPGYGLAQKLRDIERSFMVALRGTLENVGYAVAPLSEVDFSRVQRYMAEDQIGQIMPGTMVPVDPDLSGGGRPAHYFHTVPSIAGNMTALMSFFMELADRHTGLPAALSGQPIGTGVNRTFRGIMALYGNALKGVQSSLSNLDVDVFERLGQAYFNYNMLYAEDEGVKGDAQCKSRGTSGLLQKEIAKQGAQESLQFIAQLAPSGAVSGPVLHWAVEQALLANGVPKSVIDEGAAPGGVAGVGGAATGGPGPAGVANAGVNGAANGAL